MENYEIREFRPNRHVKIVDGHVVGKATPGEIDCYKFRKKFADIDTGVIELSLALTGVSGVLFALNLPTLEKLLSTVAFIFSIGASAFLCWFFVLQRIPIVLTRFHEFRTSRLTSRLTKNVPFLLSLWLLYYYPILATKALRGETLDEQVEFGYLSLIACLAVLLIVVTTIGLS